MLTREGRIKILDFGLAKVLPVVGGRRDPPATLGDVTTPGLVVGTVGYMAPEQVRGDAVDHRAEIFALGCILYEMLGGRRAFAGASAIDTLGLILRDDPPVLTRREVPLRVFRLDRDTGKRELWAELPSRDPAGLQAAFPGAAVSRDGRTVVGTYSRRLNRLYVVTGVH